MQGLELARSFYDEFGRGLLEAVPQAAPFTAAGLFGSGSECFGFDDEVSRDHDFEPGFMLLLPSEEVVDRRTAFLLERAYAKLPKEFMGMKRSLVSPVGGARHGVIRTADFFKEKTGSVDGNLSIEEWLRIPEASLAEAVNGKVFHDPYGEVTAIRERLKVYPEDVRLKKLAGNLLMMAQSGQYNYTRCLKHGESGAAQLAVMEFVKSTLNVIFLLNKTYQPYYKWSFRALRALGKADNVQSEDARIASALESTAPGTAVTTSGDAVMASKQTAASLSQEADLLEFLLTSGNDSTPDPEGFNPPLSETKQDLMESIAADVIEELQNQGITEAICGDLEKHAYSVNDQIQDGFVRNLHILAAV